MKRMQQTDSEPRYVLLGNGIAMPLEPILLCLDIERRGLRLERLGDDLGISPRGMLTDADRKGLTRWKQHVLLLLTHCERIQ
jgi:hypothetical protein